MDSADKARYIIANNQLLVIASADAAGKPWVSPVGFVYDQQYNFYWVSSRQALHSQNIAHRPQIALSIFGQLPEGGYDGVYVDAEAFELSDEAEIQLVIQLFREHRPQPSRFEVKSTGDVTGGADWRIYKAVTKRLSKRVDGMLHGQAITRREIIRL